MVVMELYRVQARLPGRLPFLCCGGVLILTSGQYG